METDLLLLEREPYLAQLATQCEQAIHGAGRTVLVSGEAGIGKTTLVEHFAQRQRDSARLLWGACEALFTPRPLGPLHDIAHAMPGSELHALLKRGADRPALFAALLDELRPSARPSIVVFEDVHWADEATLDLIKFLGRRIYQTAALFILTYRDDEIGRDHPLRYVLGDLPPRAVTRIVLPPLSEAGVAALARATHRSAEQLYAATGGNPFFVTEVLASTSPGLPVTVRDAVLARVARLPAATQRIVELVSVAPARMEYALIAATAGMDAAEAALDPALSAGILHQEEEAVAFRHELARQAVEGALAPLERQALHARVLSALLSCDDQQVQVARLVHHAEHAGDRESVLRYAPQAAREAAAHGAHREAAAHYATALRYGDGLAPEMRAELLEGLAYECYLTGTMEDAVHARLDALAIWRQLDRHEAVGRNLRWLSRQSWYLGRNADAERYAEEAVQLLETFVPSRELAMAYSNQSQLSMLVEDVEQARSWGARALTLARHMKDAEIESHALNNIGSAELLAGDEHGRELLEESLRLARAHQLEEHVSRAFNNLIDCDVLAHAHARASATLAEGMSYCAERDLDSWGLYMQGWRARVRLNQGDWAGAAEDAIPLVTRTLLPAVIRLPALTVIAWLRVRRGDPGTRAVLDEAHDLAAATGELQRIVPVASARAEFAWLHGDLVGCREEARVGYVVAREHRNPWQLGEIAYWLWRAEGLNEAPHQIAEPYRLMIAGDWQAAAAQWEQLGSVYQRALALVDGDAPAQRHALALFESLGARPAAELVRRRLREQGVRGVARGPRPTTRTNPYGLTGRQLEILRLLVEGLRNAEIAERLSTSPKTVDHHVSAVLGKLGVRSRAEAIALAHQIGITPANVGSPQREDG